MVGDVVDMRNKLEGQYFAQQKDIEEKALQILKTSRMDAIGFLNSYSVEMADLTIKEWKALGENLLLKYIDGVSKDEQEKALLIKPQDEGLKAKVAKLDEILKKITEMHESNF